MTDESFAPQAPAVARDTLTVVETVLLCAGRKVTFEELLDCFWGTLQEDELSALLAALPAHWGSKGFELANAGKLWWVRAREDVKPHLQKAAAAAAAPKASRAFLEVLAVIAYTQPCTREDIEEKRGQPVPPSLLEQLTNRGWIEVIGHRSSAKDAALYATTNKFLDDLNLFTLDDLPSPDSSAKPVPAPEPVEFDAYIPYDGPLPKLPGD